MTPDPYEPHLRQADDLFAQGELVKAGQIWQAVLKQQPNHAEARGRLLEVKQRLLALRAAEAAAPETTTPAESPLRPEPESAPEPAPEARPTPAPEAVSMPESEPLPEPLPDPVAEPSLAATASEPAPEPPTAVPADPPPPLAPPSEPVQVITGALNPERLVAEGCTLYDMGQLEDALGKWEAALALDPAHGLARSYANGARRELGLATLHATASPEPAPEAIHHADEDIDLLLRSAVQLYDMGLTEEAITKWERVLTLEPQRLEIEGYLRQARTEVSFSATSPTLVAPVQAAPPESEALDLKLRQAEHLLTLQRPEEAAYSFQQALSLNPGNARALQGLERCRKPANPAPGGLVSRPAPAPAPAVSFDAQGRIAMADDDTLVITEPQGVEPPAALLQSVPTPRKGLSLPDRFKGLSEHFPFLKDTKILAILGGCLLVMVVGLSLVHRYRKDQALKEEVRAARAAAVAPVAQQAQAPSLAEAPAALREEAEAALGVDPLRAYLRAETFFQRNSGDTSGASLLEKARAGLAGGVTGASLPEFQNHLQNGDLEAALKVMDALLRAQPEDAQLRSRAGRLHLALCSAHANQAKWEEAQEDLLRGRALFPSDKSWQVRLKLLEHIKALPKGQQAAWIALLG